MLDMTAQQIAEFLMLQNDEYERPQKWVKVIPYYGMHETYRQSPNDPIALMAGIIMPDVSFLGYIATVIRHTKNAQWYYQMRSMSLKGNDYAMVNLMPSGVKASEIAKLTGYDIEMVRDFYRDYFVVDSEV